MIDPGSRRWPTATLAVFAVTVICTILALRDPALTALLKRTPTMLSHWELWRFITPVLINPEGWIQRVVNGVSFLLVAPWVEKRFGSGRWLVLYFLSALTGEIAGAFWQPDSAGSSVAIVGLIGAYVAALVQAPHPRQKLTALAALLFAVFLTARRDIHGPPGLLGFALAFAMPRKAPAPAN
ncbi:MAG: rhomboid family serine protease [Caulobacteraceae bacterium]|nr:rhomboid family serine protease [Caulobacteraceae bacterium]